MKWITQNKLESTDQMGIKGYNSFEMKVQKYYLLNYSIFKIIINRYF